MPETEFNLLEEPWIIAIDLEGGTESYSLIDIFTKAHMLKSLAGEMPAQDVAIMRLLLAILYSVYPYVDDDGVPLPADLDVIQFWNDLWSRGVFCIDTISNYLAKFHDKFWLFHPERPFWQVSGMKNGTSYKASKLQGEMSESNNKIRLFQNRSGEAKTGLVYSEAARWLLYLNAFDDNASKQSKETKKKLPSPHAGWLGRLGIIYAAGKNLFETLMLNFILVNDNDVRWETGGAVWELERPRIAERVAIQIPKSQAELLTLQSRRIILERANGLVTGYKLLGGDFFENENAFEEQMTLWKKDKKRDDIYVPKRHDPARQLWRDFASLLAKNDGARMPGLIFWLSRLENRKLISTRNVFINTASVQYADKDFNINDTFSDSLSINAGFLVELGESWIIRINNEINAIDKMVGALGWFASDLAEASGDKSGGASIRKEARENAYYTLDEPFRIWLSGIKPQTDDIDVMCDDIRETASGIIRDIGSDLVASSGSQAFVGNRSSSSAELKTSPLAYIKFLNILNKITFG